MNAPQIRARLSPSQMQALGDIIDVKRSTIGLLAEIPAANYVDPARFELEKQAIFLREPVLVGPSAYLPAPNTYLPKEILGVPLVITRDAAGRARAFLNVCTHRGTLVCNNAETAHGPRMVCPYHAWGFAMDGQLASVPREEVFPGLDKRQLGLVPLPCQEAGGMIYVGLKPDAKIDFSSVTGALAADLDGMGLAGMEVYNQTTFPLQANWKLAMDSMLDMYHVARLHANTLAKFFEDVPEVAHMVGRHVRASGGRLSFRPEDVTEDFDRARRRITFCYNIVPNAIIINSPRYVNLCVLRPIGVDRTDVDYVMLANKGPRSPEDEDKLRQSWELMTYGFGKEDFWASEIGHKGLASGALKTIKVGGLERRMKMFHDVIEDIIARYQAETA